MGDIHIIEVQEQPTLGIRQVVRMAEIRAVFDAGFTRVISAVQAAGSSPAGAPYARYRGMPGETVDVEVGFPVTSPVDGEGDLVSGALPAARVVETVHRGSYETLSETYEDLQAWVAEQGLRALEEFWEIYEAGPDSDPDPDTWRTRIQSPVSAAQLTEH